MRSPLTQLEKQKFINQPDVALEEFIERNIPFILQLATVYLAQSDHINVTDKLTEMLLQDLLHNTLGAKDFQNERTEPTASIKALGYLPPLGNVLSLD